MTDILENKEMTEINEGEMNFEEMLEESLKSFTTDEKVHGVVVGIAPNEIYVDVGRKQAGFVPLAELSADPNAKAEDLVKIGDEMDLLIMRTNDQEAPLCFPRSAWMPLKAGKRLLKPMKMKRLSPVLSRRLLRAV